MYRRFGSGAAKYAFWCQSTRKQYTRARQWPRAVQNALITDAQSVFGRTQGAGIAEIQRTSRVLEWAPQNAPWIRAGATKKVQKAELKKTKRAGRLDVENNLDFFSQTTGRHSPGARRETTEVKTRKCQACRLADLGARAVLTSGMRAGTRIETQVPKITAVRPTPS